MRLTNTSYVVLGMLNAGARSGYDIRRSVELSASHFLKISPPQIYPELQRLEEAGLVIGEDDPHSGRRRRTYELTAVGKAALGEWLANGEESPLELRDVGLLKLFLADAMDRRQAIAHVGSLRERSERMVEEFRTEIIPVANAARERGDLIFPAEAARLGLELNEWLVGWYGRLERDLKAE